LNGAGYKGLQVGALALPKSEYSERRSASKLLRRGQPYETRFFATEEQARAWIAQKRA
jgi:hypothetical protein